MTPTHAIQTALEFVLVAVALWGTFNEERIAVWERRLFRKLKRRFTK